MNDGERDTPFRCSLRKVYALHVCHFSVYTFITFRINKDAAVKRTSRLQRRHTTKPSPFGYPLVPVGSPVATGNATATPDLVPLPDSLRLQLAPNSRRRDEFITIPEAFAFLKEKLSGSFPLDVKTSPGLDAGADDALLLSFLIKKIFQGEVSIGVPAEPEEQAPQTDLKPKKYVFSLPSMKHGYDQLVKALKGDFSNMYLDSLILEQGKKLCGANEFHSPEGCSYCPDYKELIRYGVVKSEDGYYTLKLREEYQLYSVVESARSHDEGVRIEHIECVCKHRTAHINFIATQQGMSLAVFHADAHGKKTGYPANSYFIEYIRNIIKRFNEFRGDGVDALFALFLTVHGVIHDGVNIPFASSVSFRFFESKVNASSTFQSSALLFCKSILVEQDSLKSMIDHLAVSDLTEYRDTPFSPFVGKSDNEKPSEDAFNDHFDEMDFDEATLDALDEDCKHAQTIDASSETESCVENDEPSADISKTAFNSEKWAKDSKQAKKAWSALDRTGMTDEENLCVDMMIDWCEDSTYDQLLGKYEERSGRTKRKSKRSEPFVNSYLVTIANRIRNKYKNLPPKPKRQTKARTSRR